MFRKLLVILLVFLNTLVAGQTLVFKNFSVNNGVASSTVYAIHQDSKGFIWFATENGVNRFDGKNFELFTIDNSLSDNEVLHIDEDSKGRIWFLTLNGKLSYYYNKKFHNTVNDPLLRKTICKASFSSFFEDSRHHIWISTNQNKLLEINNNEVKFHSVAVPLNGVVLFENAEKHLCGITKSHFLELKKDKFVPGDLPEYPVSARAVWYNASTRSVQYISPTGLVNLKWGYATIVKYFPEDVQSSSLGKFIRDDQNNLWVSSMGNGIYLFKGSGNNARHYLKENIITDLMQDRQGNIWISTIGNGIFMLPSYARSSVNYTSADGLSSDAVHSVIKVKDNVVMGLRNGTINVLSNGVVDSYLKSSDYNPIKQLRYDPENSTIWYASDHRLGELSLLSRQENALEEETHGSYAVKSFSMNSSGKLAVALASGVYVISKQKPLLFNSKSVLNNNTQFLTRSFTVFYDSANRLWLANLNGLFCYYKNILLYKNNEIRSQRITDIKELPDKSIICSTVGFGALVIKNLNKHSTITLKDGLSSNICKRIFIKDSAAWIVTGKGISRLGFGKNSSIKNYGTENGLITTEVNDLFVDGDSIYAATNQGLSIIRATPLSTETESPPLYLNQFLSNKAVIKMDGEISIPYKGNNITVNYITLDYEHPQSVKYSYKLNPEFRWNETSSTSLEFASLQPGSYHLQIRAKCINSNWTRPVEIQFTINPPLWRTWWFILLLLIALGGIIFFALNRYHKSKRAKENERLLTQTKIISLEQQALQAMMNPHFVFNVMNSIQYFINTKDNAMANQALTGFARLLRKNLENCNKSYITLEEELQYLNLYLSLEKMRFGDRMNYNIQVQDEIERTSTYIPSMLLQPYVENAIWHGLMPKDADGNIWINIRKLNDQILQIEIIDDGIGIENSLQHKPEGHISRGMQLTRERISLMNKFKEQPILIEAKQLHPEGTSVILQIPF